MKANHAAERKGPIEVVKEGNIRVPIYETINRIYRQRGDAGEKQLVAEHPQFAISYYQGNKRILRKFTDLTTARREAQSIILNLVNGDSEALKLTGADRSTYVSAMQKLRAWSAAADLNVAIADYVAAARRLPNGVTLQQAVAEFLLRHPSGLPKKTVREVLNELLAAKTGAGRSRAYVTDLSKRLARFADAFGVPIATVTGAEINDWIAGLKLSGRSQINFRRVIATLFKFAKARKYLPKDWDEMGAVERPDDDSGEIEVFSVAELRKLFAARFQTVTERGA